MDSNGKGLLREKPLVFPLSISSTGRRSPPKADDVRFHAGQPYKRARRRFRRALFAYDGSSTTNVEFLERFLFLSWLEIRNPATSMSCVSLYL